MHKNNEIKYNRKKTKEVKVGNLFIGNHNPIIIQSMTNTHAHDTKSTIKQILELEKEGCEIIRVTVPDMICANNLSEIIKNINIPLVADIHFDYKLAIKSAEMGVSKLRLNPGNIGNRDKVLEVVKVAKERNIPIRIGVNGGSLSRNIADKFGGSTPAALVYSAMEHVHILEDLNFENIIISIKSSNIEKTLESYELLSKEVDYPLHVGITEAGGRLSGIIKSSSGLGSILSRGIGDTIRVSLTDNPIEEIKTAKILLQSMGLRKFGTEIISCPTCGRTEVDLISISTKIEDELSAINKDLTVAIMGCVVNGPGEAKEADIGVACKKGGAVLFKKGEVVCNLKEDKIVETLLNEIKNM